MAEQGGTPNKKERRKARRQEYIKELREANVITSREVESISRKVGLDAASGTADDPVLTPPSVWGRADSPLDSHDCDKIVELLSAGYNRTAATQGAMVDYRRFLRHLRTDEEFRSRVIVAENSCEGHCMAEIYSDAMDPLSSTRMTSAAKFIGLKDAARRGNFARKSTVALLHMRKQVIERSLGIDSQSQSRPDLSCIPEEHFDDFNSICDKLVSGEDLTTDEAVRYARYQSMIARASAPPKPHPSLVIEAISGPLVDEKIVGDIIN